MNLQLPEGKQGERQIGSLGLTCTHYCFFFFFKDFFFLLFDTKTQATKQSQMGLHQTSAQQKDISSL